MATQPRSPFEVLGISPDAEIVVVWASYRALARKYHPDLNPGVSPGELNRRMTELNWAKEELENDLEGWRRKVGTTPPSEPEAKRSGARKTGTKKATAPQASEALVVEPAVLSLAGRQGSTDTFTAKARGASRGSIKARFKIGTVEVERVEERPGLATFRVVVTEDFASDITDPDIQTVELVAPGFVGAKLFVYIAPMSRAVLEQEYGARIAPPRHAGATARISFGKHRGSTFHEIAVSEPNYLEWMLGEGAGTHIERESARLAIEGLGAGSWLPPPKSRAPRRLAPKKSRPRRRVAASPPPKRLLLDDPTKPRGLLGAIRSLFGLKESS